MSTPAWTCIGFVTGWLLAIYTRKLLVWWAIRRMQRRLGPEIEQIVRRRSVDRGDCDE